MIRTLSVLAVLLVGFAPFAAAGVSLGVDQTLGSDNYRGTRAKASLDLTDSIYIEPSFSIHRTDSSSGSFKTFALRAGYETGPAALGAEAGFQPKTNGYAKSFVGADLTFSLSPGGTSHGHRLAGRSSEGAETFGSGLAAVDLGVSARHTRHSDDWSAAGTSGSARRRAGALRSSAFSVGQTDLSAFAGAKFLILEASAEAVRSVYDKNLEDNGAREAQALSLGGFGVVVQGFPESSFNAKLKVKTLPMVRPYASYTRTKFKMGGEPSDAVELGGTVGLQMLNVRAAYHRYTQKGFPDQNGFTVGAGLNF